MRRNAVTRATSTIGQLGRDIQTPLGTFLHQLQGFGPTSDHTANREFGRLAALVGAVEDLTGNQRAFVVSANSCTGVRRCTRTGGNNLVLQTGFQGNDTLTLGILGQEINAGLCSLRRSGFSSGLHLALQHLERRLQLCLRHLAGLLLESVLQAGRNQLQRQIGNIAGQQLLAHLTADAVADAFLVGINHVAHGEPPQKMANKPDTLSAKIHPVLRISYNASLSALLTGKPPLMLEKLFKLRENGSNVRTEVLAGVTTFLTMAYIIFVNPMMMADAGIDPGAAFVATCLAAAIGSLVMGLWANYPIALAPGMGLNAFFSYTVVGSMGYSWQVALGAVFLSGFLFFLLSLFRIREWIINSIPLPLRSAIAAGIGLFLALIALKSAGLVVDHPATLVALGDLSKPEPLLAAAGFAVIVALAYRKVTGAVMIGILLITAISFIIGLSHINGIVSAPPSLKPTFLELDIKGALEVGLLSVIFAFLFVDLFDTSGTLIGVAQKANLVEPDGKMPRLGRALMADSTATMAGAALGTSTTTSYIESTAGISAGGRTGLTACVVALLFLLSMFFSPLATAVPGYATAPALLFVAVLMTHGLVQINWDDLTEAAPVVVTALAMPLTFSIANGIALGFISWTLIKVLAGRWRDLNPSLYILAGLFVIKLALFN